MGGTASSGAGEVAATRIESEGVLPAGVVPWTLAAFALVAAILFMNGRRDYPNLHEMLDTAVGLLSCVLALLLWDIAARTGRPFPKWLAVSFAVAAVSELLHALVTVEWFGTLAPISAAREQLRPATWPIANYVRSLGVGTSVWLLLRGRERAQWLAPALVILSAALFPVFYWLPRYTEPVLFGITRPWLAGVPLLWMAIGWQCWRHRHADRLLPALVLMASVLVPGHICMLYSRAPHDTQAMVAHLGKAAAFLVLLLALMRMATGEMRERIRAQQAVTRLNEDLEQRVLERTTQLQATYKQSQMQLARLDLLNQITQAIGKRQDLGSILQVVLQTLEERLPLEMGCICTYDPVSSLLTVSCVGARSRELASSLGIIEGAPIPVDENGLVRCVHGQLVYEPQIDQLPFSFPRKLAAGGLRALVVAPLQIESKVFGVLVAARCAPDSFVSGECEFLRQLSEHVALAAHQAETHLALQQAYEDLRQTQQAVMQQERLRALGQMASGIAHDINNAISPISIYTEMLLMHEKNLRPEARNRLEVIQRAIDDVSQTVARMREFYRPRQQHSALFPVELNRLVQQVIDLTRARWSDLPQQRGVVIEIRPELGFALPTLMGVESDIREALTNLIFNAVDAMPDGGVLTLSTGTTSDRSRVYVEVGDTGVGMTEETRRRCLEPFFTTKGERGTGLGLAMVYGVAQRHEAEIEIDSVVGSGTSIRLTFNAQLAAGLPAATEDSFGPPPRLRILIIDDDPLLLKSLRDILEAEGHSVSSAAGGQEGIDAFTLGHRDNATFEVVITDLGMPHVDGRRVAQGIKAVSGTTPVILLTGWGQRLIASGETPPHVNHVLSKPPRLQQLRAVLARCRGSPR